MNLSTDIKTFVIYFLLVMVAVFTIVIFFLWQSVLNVQENVVQIGKVVTDLQNTTIGLQNTTLQNQQFILDNKELQQNNTSKILKEHMETEEGK